MAKPKTRLTKVIKGKVIDGFECDFVEAKKHLRELQDKTARVLNAIVRRIYIEHVENKRNLGELRSLAYKAAGEEITKNDFGIRSHMQAEISNHAYKEYCDYISDYNKRNILRSLPSFKDSTPILVRGDAWKLSKVKNEKNEDRYVITINLVYATYSFFIAISGKNHYAQIYQLLNDKVGVYKLANLKLKWDRNKHCWFASLCYTTPIPKKVLGQTVAVHRGVNSFLYIVAEDGDTRVLVGGHDIVAKKNQFKKRGAELRRHLAELGSGAQGHGHDRRYATIDQLGKKEENFVETKCNQAAAMLVKYGKEHNVGRFLFEDYGTINDDNMFSYLIKRFPWSKIKEKCSFACEKAGFKFQEVETANSLDHCPNCNDKNKEKKHIITVKDGQFYCTKCAFTRRSDYAFCVNMLKRAGCDISRVLKSHFENVKEAEMVLEKAIEEMGEEK